MYYSIHDSWYIPNAQVQDQVSAFQLRYQGVSSLVFFFGSGIVHTEEVPVKYLPQTLLNEENLFVVGFPLNGISHDKADEKALGSSLDE